MDIEFENYWVIQKNKYQLVALVLITLCCVSEKKSTFLAVI